MKKNLLIASALALALSLVACGGGNDVPKGKISQERSASFKAFFPTFSDMGKVVKSDDPYNVEQFKSEAEEFAKAAHVPFESFQSDPDGNGDALPQVWQKSDEFAAKRDEFFAAVDNLNAQAQKGNLAEIKVAYEKVEGSCKSCHREFRRPK